MNRRRFIQTGLIAVSSISLAGCSSDEGDFEEGDGSTDGGDDGDDEDGSSSDVELLEHEMVRDEGEYTTELKVTGQAENVSDSELEYAEVEVKFTNDGAVEESSIDNVNGLGAGEKWNFEVLYLGQNTEDIDDYQIRAGTSL